jgi:homoserine kinase
VKATVFAPGSVGNVGPGFDVLGLAIDGAGDTVTVELAEEASVIVKGPDADAIPTDPRLNAASIAAAAMLQRRGRGPAKVTVEKGLRTSGGLGGSAASSVAGAYAAALACGVEPTPEEIMLAALEGETVVSGRHLDNIAPITLGGLVLTRSIDPVEVVSLNVPSDWSVALNTPDVRVETKQARSILPEMWDRASWVQQMANTGALIAAFTTGDGLLARRALDDLYAEPRRAPLIPNFLHVKRAALECGAFGCSISGSGPTIFAIVNEKTAAPCLAAMKLAMKDVKHDARIAPIARRGARAV